VHGEVPLFDSLQTIYKVRQARHLVASARYDEAFVRMEAALLASDAYLHALAAERSLAVMEEVCRTSEVDIAQAEELKAKGMVLGADFYAAKVTLSRLKNMKNEALARNEALHALLNILMGEDPLAPLRLADPGGAMKPAEKELGEWLAEAYRLRPDYLSLEEALRAQEAEVGRERARALPDISAFGDLQENTHDFDTGGGNFAVGIKGSLNIFDPEYFARVKAARETLRAMESDRAAARDLIAKDLTEEYARSRSIRSSLPVFREMSDDSAQAVTLMAPLYQEGRKSIADLLSMRQAYLEAHQGYYEMLMGSRVSRAKLLFLSGQLDPASALQVFQGGE
jgi:outer membrane protein TolC